VQPINVVYGESVTIEWLLAKHNIIAVVTAVNTFLCYKVVSRAAGMKPGWRPKTGTSSVTLP
jgi:hypothetical protein